MNDAPTFLENAKLGRSNWWLYLAGWLVAVVPNTILSIILYVGILMAAGFDPVKHSIPDDARGFRDLGFDPLIAYVAMNATFLLWIALLWIIVRFFHGRPFRTLMTSRPRFDFGRLETGFWIWLGVSLIGGGVTIVVFQQDFAVNLQLKRFFSALPFILLCTPLQCLAEELAFRGYALQTCSLFTRNIWVLAIINMFIFAVPHMANPEVQVAPLPVFLSYALIGFVLAIITLKTNGIEMAVGIHTANNLFCAAVLNYTVTPLFTPSIVLGNKIHPWFDLGVLAAMSVAAYWSCTWFERRVGPPGPPATITTS